MHNKPGGSTPINQDWEWRKDFYLSLIDAASREIPDGLMLAIDIADLPSVSPSLPLFTFQKQIGANSLLLPDPDFFSWDWYIGNEIDTRAPFLKRPAAIFAGSSTGTLVLTEDIVKNNLSPRLHLADEALDYPSVDFWICNAVQYDNETTRLLLENKPYFHSPVNFENQYDYRYIISVDGNGPTCARVAIALLSNSVLLKQNSKQQLYWYRGMKEGVHYLGFDSISDAAERIKNFNRKPRRLSRIRRAANNYALTYLSKTAVEAYTETLIRGYAQRFFPKLLN